MSAIAEHDAEIEASVRWRPGDTDARFVRGIKLYKAAYRARFEEYWLQFGNFDPFAKALTRAAFRNN